MKNFASTLAVIALVGLAACSKVTPDNYDKVESGMSKAEVHQLLGSPDDVSSTGIGSLTMTSETWNGPKFRVKVTYAGDKTTLKSIEPRDGK